MKSIIEFICSELNCNDKTNEFIKKFLPNAKEVIIEMCFQLGGHGVSKFKNIKSKDYKGY